MPKRNNYDDEDDINNQQWTPIIISKEPIMTKDKVEITFDQFLHKLISKREEQKLSQIQLNVKCKFPYKYTIRDIESRRCNPTSLEIKTISNVLDF